MQVDNMAKIRKAPKPSTARYNFLWQFTSQGEWRDLVLSVLTIFATFNDLATLYGGQIDCPPFPEDAFKELTLIAT